MSPQEALDFDLTMSLAGEDMDAARTQEALQTENPLGAVLGLLMQLLVRT